MYPTQQLNYVILQHTSENTFVWTSFGRSIMRFVARSHSIQHVEWGFDPLDIITFAGVHVPYLWSQRTDMIKRTCGAHAVRPTPDLSTARSASIAVRFAV